MAEAPKPFTTAAPRVVADAFDYNAHTEFVRKVLEAGLDDDDDDDDDAVYDELEKGAGPPLHDCSGVLSQLQEQPQLPLPQSVSGSRWSEVLSQEFEQHAPQQQQQQQPWGMPTAPPPPEWGQEQQQQGVQQPKQYGDRQFEDPQQLRHQQQLPVVFQAQDQWSNTPSQQPEWVMEQQQQQQEQLQQQQEQLQQQQQQKQQEQLQPLEPQDGQSPGWESPSSQDTQQHDREQHQHQLQVESAKPQQGLPHTPGEEQHRHQQLGPTDSGSQEPGQGSPPSQ
jgi:hypothetical protein